MGAILHREQIDPRLQALESAAYADMHGLAGAVHRSMEVAAARRVRELEAVVRSQRERLGRVVPAAWSRPCWHCGAPAACPHREEELVSIWRIESCR